MNRMFKRPNRNENNTQQTTATKNEKTEETDDKSPPHPTSIFVTTINPDSSITEEQKVLTPATPNKTEENTDLKFTPLERKSKYTFIMLISHQGQEVLKSNHLNLSCTFEIITMCFFLFRKLVVICWIITTTFECCYYKCKTLIDI